MGLESLPREIILDILSRLPTSSLCNVKLVCQSWRSFAQDPALVDMHFTRMPKDSPCLILHTDLPSRNQLYALYLYAHKHNIGVLKRLAAPDLLPEFDVVGSCNGWLLLCDSSLKSTLHLYNPVTRELSQLPKSTNDSQTKYIRYEFCFNMTSKEYKVIQLTHPRRMRPMCGSPERSDIQILTLGSSTWRSSRHVFHHLMQSPLPSKTLVNGRLHWLSWPLRSRSPLGKVVVSFDLTDERLREVPMPETERFRWRVHNLLVLDECLSATVYWDGGLFEIWTMQDYGVRESWIKKFCIGKYVPRGLEEDVDCSFEVSKLYRKRSFIRALCQLKNGEILLEYMCRALVSYDPKSEMFRDVRVPGMPNWFEAVAYEGINNSSDTIPGIKQLC